MLKSKKPTVALLFGFAEGEWHARDLKKELSKAGFIVSNDCYRANILIAHSAGSYIVPADTQAKIVLHIGYTYAPNSSISSALKKTVRRERKEYGLLRFTRNSVVHTFYMLNVRKTWRAYQDAKDTGYFLDHLASGPKHFFVRNKNDFYNNQDAFVTRGANTYTYISMPEGNHNDIWYNPRAYVTLLQSIYNKR